MGSQVLLKGSPILGFAPSSLPIISSDSPPLLSVSSAPYGPFLTEQAREVVELVERFKLTVAKAESMVHVLRHATRASDRAVYDTLRYGFDFPHLITLCGRLLTICGEMRLFLSDPADKAGGR